LVLVLWATQDLCAKKKPPLHPVNLNTASSAELQQVPGIGPSTAEKILQARKSYGAFKSVNELQAIRGIGPKKLEKMRPYLTVGKPAAAQKPSTQSAAGPKAPPAKKSPAKQPPKPQKPPAASEEEEP
jgi:competence ComEA-like helix-hairpin-helix protein